MLNLSLLNPRQREAVETLEGPLLILAGAGTGKTRVITWRIAHLIERGESPGAILAVTFTNKAAREMAQRAGQLIGRSGAGSTGEKRPTICTFHSLGARILREHIRALGYQPNFVVYGESEQLALLRKLLSHIHSGSDRPDPGLVLACLSKIRNGARLGGELTGLAQSLAAHLQSKYEGALRAANAVDFDDLILLPLKLLAARPDICRQFHDRFRYIMVDEYQDTNAAQFKLLQCLVGPAQNLCVVGDDDQSIYGWRGAETANLLELEKHYPRVRVVALEQNYRSTNTILEAANAVIRHNPRRRSKKLWSNQGPGEKIVLEGFANEEAEAQGIVEQISFYRQLEKRGLGEFAVLFRTNQQSRALESALRKAGMPYRVIGGQSYFDRKEIKDFLAYLKLFLNPADEISLTRIANVPARGISEATLEKLLSISHQRAEPVFRSMQSPEVLAAFPAKTAQAVAAFAAFVEKHRATLRAPGVGRLAEWARGWLAESGYLEYLTRSSPPGEGESRVQTIEQFLASPDFNAVGEDALHGLLEALALEEDREEREEKERDAVQLITIHSCKGLEFTFVYIAGVEDGILPHSRAKEENTLDEERRLFYVAMTRARRSLNLSYCMGRRKYGDVVPCHPSPFLKELPAGLVERGEKRGSTRVPVEKGKDYFDGLRASVGL